jgi:hypothetical protein
MVKIVDTDVGVLVIHADVKSDADRGTAPENRWMSEVRVEDGSTILVIGPANEKRVDLVIGCGQPLNLFSAPGDRTSELPLHQQQVTGLQTGDTILYQVTPESAIVELTFTAK